MLKKKVAVIIGGARKGSIGRASVQKFTQQGWRVIVVDNDRRGLKSLRKQWKIRAGFEADVTDPNSLTNLCNSLERCEVYIDALVFCVGKNTAWSVEQITLEEWDAQLRLNLSSFIFTFKALNRFMSDDCKTVVLSSLVGVIGQRDGSAYVAAKGALSAVVKSMALDYQILINTLAPGDVDTGMWRGWLKTQPVDTDEVLRGMTVFERIAKPKEIAEWVYFLGAVNTFATGQTFVVDGGKSLG